MPLSLNTIKANKKAAKKRKRVGRGNASGHGTYSGKGLKGQKSRSGVSNLKRLGMRQVLLRTPKKRGFSSNKPKNQIINITEINDNFKDNDIISPKILLNKGLVDNANQAIKILGNGKLKLKGLKIEGVKMSESVKKQISGSSASKIALSTTEKPGTKAS